MRRSRLTPTLAALALLLPSLAVAGGTRSRLVDTFDELDEGTAKGVAIEASGTVTRGAVTTRAELLDSNAAFSCLAGSKGAYVGTADEASVRTVTVKKGAPASELLAKLPGVVVTAMEELPDGDLVVATLPGGELHRVTRRGKVSSFATLDGVKRIWALLRVGERIMVGTGPKGEVWSLDLKGGDPRVALDAEAKDVLSLLELDGAVLAGTSPSAKVFQVSDAPEGVLVQDFKGDEVRALAATAGGLVAAVNDFEDRKLGSAAALEKMLARKNLTGAAPARKSAKEASPDADATVYFVDLRDDGGSRDLNRALEATWETWLEVDDQYFTGAARDDDSILVSSSRAGRVYRVQGRRDHAVFADLDERLATSVCVTEGKAARGRPRTFATAGQGAAIYAIAPGSSQDSAYVSEVFDAGQPARYGNLLLHASGTLRAHVRVGPTEEPDDRWSAWREIKLSNDPQGQRGAIAAGPRRWMQLKIDLVSADAELRSFEYFYAPENLAPRVSEVSFEGPDFDREDDDEPEASATLSWDASDGDEDDLVFSVRIRPDGAGEDEWIDLTPRDALLTKEKLEFDIQSVPDGVYEAAIVASDELDNGTARARTDEARSAPFIVDRGRPKLTGIARQGDRFFGLASDTLSAIHDVAFSVDEGPFRAASPVDGLFDGPNENFELSLPADLDGGNHRLLIRARDAAGNLVTFALTFRS